MWVGSLTGCARRMMDRAERTDTLSRSKDCTGFPALHGNRSTSHQGGSTGSWGQVVGYLDLYEHGVMIE